MTTLENSYCVPNNSQWVELIGYVPNRDTAIYAVYDAEMGILDADDGEVNYLTEIPVQHFIDLVEDRVTPWRLRELDFKMTSSYSMVNGEKQWMYWKGTLTVTPDYASAGGGSPLYLKTFTDLLTLIKFLTPPTK